MIKDNKELNIPSQKEMLAIYRCDEISKEIYGQFSEELQLLKAKIQEDSSVFGQQGEELLTKVLQLFESSASKYHRAVFLQKEEDLKERVLRDLYSLFLDIVSKLRNSSIEEFDKSFAAFIPAEDNKLSKDFDHMSQSLREKQVSLFREKASKSILESALNWSFDEELRTLSLHIERTVESGRAVQIRRATEMAKRNLVNAVEDHLEETMEECDVHQMWKKIRELFENSKQTIIDHFSNDLMSIGVKEEVRGERIINVENEIRSQFEDSIRKFVSKSDQFLLHKFERRFRYDGGITPRRWRSDVNLEEIFQRDLEHTKKLIDLFSILRLHPDDDSLNHESAPESAILLSKKKTKEILERLHKAAEAMYMQAQAEIERDRVNTSVPLYFFGLLLLLGWNELMWIISNPFMIMFFVMIGGVVGAIYYFNLWFMIKPLYETTKGQLLNRLHELTAGVSREKPKID